MKSTGPDGSLKSVASARWNDTKSAETWSQRADEDADDEMRQAWETVVRDVVGTEPRRVLDVGTGAGFLADIYAGLGHDVVGCDLSDPMVRRARERAARDGFDARFTTGDAENLPFPDGHFDVVTNRVVIWSLPCPGVAVREWNRVLRPGGRLVLFGNHPADPCRSLSERTQEWMYGLAVRLSRGGSTMGLDADTRREWEAATAEFPFRHAPPSKIRSLFAAAGFEATHVVDVADEFDQYRGLGPWKRQVPWHVVVGRKPRDEHK